MPSSSRALPFIVLLTVAGHAAAAGAQNQQAQGFAVERLYLSAPGAGWLVMDSLDIHGGLGGAIGLTLAYASNSLHVSDGVNRTAVVANDAFADIGAAVTFKRWRFYLNLETPIVIGGQTGTAGNYSFVGPNISLGNNPDIIWDPRLGVDVRILGRPGSHFRLGASAQLLIPNGNRNDYDTDGTFRGMIRALVAGDARHFTYAAQLGVHIRPLDDSAVPGSPRGSELLFGIAAGAKLPVGSRSDWVAVVGPELHGATAFRSFFSANATALEGLLSGRLEGKRDNKAQMRIKLGIGSGLSQQFGAADWRIVAGIELFGQRAPTPLPTQ